MATLYIDNKPFEVKPGKNLLEVCLSLDIDLPYFCWHPALGSVGACRQCAVKIFKDQNDTRGKLIMSCMEPVTDNQRISVNDSEAREFRAHVIEWLMTNHPHDCAVCDEGGSCHLQDMTVMTGHAYRKFRYKKRTYRNQYLGPFINHEMNRCIQCYRCVRFYRDYAGGRDLDAFASKNNVYFGRSEEGVLENEFSGNLTEVCPTGVFTDKTLKQHYTRKWDLTMAPSICHHCSLGCNTIAGERYGSLRLIANRYHGQINGYFICDRGRFGYEFVNAKERIRKPMIQQKEVEAEEVLKEINTIWNTSKVIGIGSPRASLESNYALKKLVGDENFYQGVSSRQYELTKLGYEILKKSGVQISSVEDVEKSDAVLILGEDLTNTAPMLALAVRQSVRQQPSLEVHKANIPAWHDAAVREYVQEQKGPLFIATLSSTKLDDVATKTFHCTPDDIARIGFAIAHALDPLSPPVNKPIPLEDPVLTEIVHALKNARRPVIISGTSSGSEAVMQASVNVAMALKNHNPDTRMVFTFPECNSVGLMMLEGKSLHAAFEKIADGEADTVFILENDLYRHDESSIIDKILTHVSKLIVLDHTDHACVSIAGIVIPAGTFAESDGTLVNNEGRAQRFFQVYESSNDVKESWRWLLRIAGSLKRSPVNQWENLDDIQQSLAVESDALNRVYQAAPRSTFRVNGQKVPRQPHRYSGRTAMNAQVNVSEPKPPEDPDSYLTYTMEGYRGLPPYGEIPFFWSPGWNSVQSVNKYQEEVGAGLRGGDPGIMLIEPDVNGKLGYFSLPTDPVTVSKGELQFVPLHHIFGSEDMSARSPSVAQRIPQPYIQLNVNDAVALEVQEGGMLKFEVHGQHFQLQVKISSSLPAGVAGLPVGLPGMEFCSLPAIGKVER